MLLFGIVSVIGVGIVIVIIIDMLLLVIYECEYYCLFNVIDIDIGNVIMVWVRECYCVGVASVRVIVICYCYGYC